MTAMWTILLIILGVLLGLLTWLLITPLVIYLDSTNNEYYIKLMGIFSTSMVVIDEGVYFDIKAPFYQQRIDPFKEGHHKSTKTQKKGSTEVKKKKEGKGLTSTSKFVYSLLKTFDLKRFELSFDTDDFILNSWLAPLFFFASRHYPRARLSTNYQGNFDLKLELHNRLYRTVPPFFRLIFSDK